MTSRILILSVAVCCMAATAIANNIAVSNVMLNGQNTVSHFTLVNFDITWSNSWNTNVGTANWDAAWVFVKFRKKTSTVWNHATLNWVAGTGAADGHTVPAGATVASSNDNAAGGSRGVFVYSSAVIAQSTVNYTGAKLRWNYGVDGVIDADSVQICVEAIEMVYIPQGSYYLGDANPTVVAQFRTQAANAPFQITSEAALTLGGAVGTSLLNNNRTGQAVPLDDFDNATSQALPAAFPKGFNGFYIMKYEVSQDQYVEFLNKLTRVQQATRFVPTTVGQFMNDVAGSVAPVNRNGVKLVSDPGGLTPRVYGNDLDNVGGAGGAADGQGVACSFISTADAEAYLDWAGLRPITELEFEKACRGAGQTALAGEYAWGTAGYVNATAISNSGINTEVASSTLANCAFFNTLTGPLRVGSFAQAATTRVQAGASYYGVMDLSGNLWEFCISVGKVLGRGFTGTHGDGVLTAAGDVTNADWPTAAVGNGYSLRGSTWAGVGTDVLTVSGRTNAAWLTGTTAGVPTRYNSTGCRGGRTFP